MEVVQEADNTEALIKLEMVIVMELRREKEWQVVSGVGVDGGTEAPYHREQERHLDHGRFENMTQKTC